MGSKRAKPLFLSVTMFFCHGNSPYFKTENGSAYTINFFNHSVKNRKLNMLLLSLTILDDKGSLKCLQELQNLILPAIMFNVFVHRNL